ncbi:Aste57867_9681 [Aphanomyces stellatus]|uniref:Aste57867_9681 protein n=1 Tax=Aphanomyces stellatus TaxID=120398 RepID=A0A485KNG2_9STRA|nr:hypothetical protein As57867_009643 [Aphanomyces stellatus]VFT86560.1 Aste57867_9681 [Aphanomyces stellatus]
MVYPSRAHATLLALLGASAHAFECNPNDRQKPSLRHEGESCGGWCGSLGSCATGLHCDDNLFPLRFFPIGTPFNSVCRNATKDNLVWASLSWFTPGDASSAIFLDLSTDSDYAVVAKIVESSVAATPTFHFDPVVRVLSAKRCDTEYALVLERLATPPQRFLFTQPLDGSTSALRGIDGSLF